MICARNVKRFLTIYPVLSVDGIEALSLRINELLGSIFMLLY